jgi:hypothetical protein
VSLLAVLLAAAQALSGNRQIIVRIITVNGLRNCAVFFTIFLMSVFKFISRSLAQPGNADPEALPR